MKNILITGATGNVGKSVINHLFEHKLEEISIFAGVRNIEKAKAHFDQDILQFRAFDFEQPDKEVFNDIDMVFLLRPPQIADVKKYFDPLVEQMQKAKVKHVVFLSVQGAEKIKFIPHHKIEKLIENSSLTYTFLRPSYFMQNFTTTLRTELVERDRIFLPSGKAFFNFIDVEDIGIFAAKIFLEAEKHQNKAYVLTSDKNITFKQAAKILSEELNRKIKYKSPCVIRFFFHQRKKGISTPMIMVMIMLHFLPRFQKAPKISTDFYDITGKSPRNFRFFVAREKEFLS